MDAAEKACQFLDAVRIRPASSCATCLHPRRVEVDAALRRYAEMRVAKTTFISLSAFVERFLRPEYDYKHSAPAAERHLRGCLGLEVPK